MVIDEITHWNAYCLRMTQSPSGNAISLLELALPTIAPPPVPFPITIGMVNLLPSCGVLTVGGASSLKLHGFLPYNAILWNSVARTTIAVSKLEREGFDKRSVASAFSHHREPARETSRQPERYRQSGPSPPSTPWMVERLDWRTWPHMIERLAPE